MNTKALIARWSSQSAGEIATRASEQLPPWVSLGLVIMIAWYLAKMVWLIYPTHDTDLWAPPQASPTGRVNEAARTTNGDYSAISTAHLFGSAVESDAPVVVESTEAAPDTRLNLKLRAAVAASNPDMAHAIIADDSGIENVYFVTDPVPGGATVYRIEPDRVLLNRGGVIEALRLPKEFQNAVASAAQAAQVGRTTRKRGAPAIPDVQRFMAENASSFTDVIRPQPFMPNGEMKGYRVFPGRNRSQFLKLGLRPGDLVTQINGVPLTDPAQGMDIFGTLSESSQINVTIERNGQPQQISMDMNDVMNAEAGPR